MLSSEMIFLTRPFVGEDEVQAVRKVIQSKYLTEGPLTAEFEKQFAEYLGVKHENRDDILYHRYGGMPQGRRSWSR